jgi:hypothetical protein
MERCYAPVRVLECVCVCVCVCAREKKGGGRMSHVVHLVQQTDRGCCDAEFLVCTGGLFTFRSVH